MISAATIAALEARKIDYILGARERSSKEVRESVLHDDGAAVPLTIPRQKGETDLAVTEVKVEGRRYIVCRNEEEARKDAETRAKLLAGLQRKLAGGAKGLVGNTGYRRFLAVSDAAAAHCGRRWHRDRVGSWKQHRPWPLFRPILTLRTLIRQVVRAPVARGSMSFHAASGGELGRPSRSARSSWRALDLS